MTLHLADLFDLADLDDAVAQRLVTVRSQGDLRIFNYTEAAAYARAWTPVTVYCRGLIALPDGTVVARPWPKFFNFEEPAAPAVDLEAAVEVTDKHDGSLGILYPAPDGRNAVATRGAFESAQALHASELYRQEYERAWRPESGWTYLWEIVYPANRIVRCYGTIDDLYLLGAVEIAIGRLAGPQDDVCREWPGPRTEIFDYSTLAGALAAEPRPNAEGVVVRYLDGPLTGTMVKLKQADYVAMHRIVAGYTPRRLWERCAVHDVAAHFPHAAPAQLARWLKLNTADVQEILDSGPDWAASVRRTAPEEFTEWIDATVTELAGRVRQVTDEVTTQLDRYRGLDRAAVARSVAGNPLRGLIFQALDGRPWRGQTWLAVRPGAEPPFGAHSEDVA